MESDENQRGASYNKTHIESEYGFVLDVVTGDLFSCGDTISLAHCVSRDYKLGKGIAKIFREKFGRISELERSGAAVGEVAVLDDEKRFIYNLVTKARYYDKPTYGSLQSSLEAMREHAKERGVKEIAMPKIGCGLDGLRWNTVRTLIKNVFLQEEIKITVYCLGSADSVFVAEVQ